MWVSRTRGRGLHTAHRARLARRPGSGACTPSEPGAMLVHALPGTHA